MEKFLINPDEKTVNKYLSDGWRIKIINTPVIWNGISDYSESKVSLYLVLEREDEKEKQLTSSNTTDNNNQSVVFEGPDYLRCSVEGCNGKVHSKGLCHYHYYVKYGSFDNQSQNDDV